jgi:hypothetical protein
MEKNKGEMKRSEKKGRGTYRSEKKGEGTYRSKNKRDMKE